jgi:hypothetical protein
MDERGEGVNLRAFASSDKPEKLLLLNSGWSCLLVRMRVESIQPPKPFQSEYKVRFRSTASGFPEASHFELFGLKSVLRSIPTEENPIEGSMQVGRHICRNGR